MRVSLLKRMGFKQKLSLSYLAVVVIPILILGLYFYEQSTKRLQEQAQKNLEAFASKIVDNIENRLDGYEAIIRFITFNTRLQQVLNNNYENFADLSVDYIKEVEPFFSNIMAMNKDIRQITIFSATGLPQFGNHIQPVGVIANSDWYAAAGKSNEVGWFFENGELFAVQKITDIYSNRILGYLYVKLEHDRILDSSLVTEVNEYGIVIADKRNETVYSREVNGEAVSSFEHANNPFGYADKYIVATKQIARAALSLTYFLPIDGIQREMGSILRVALTIAFVCLAIVVVAILFFSQTFARRIQRLIGYMRKVEKGDFELAIHSDHLDEIGKLTNQFGKMVRRLDKLIKDDYKKEIAKKEAELRALQSQINPHFLYNSLSIVNWKAIRMGADEISYVATRLSKFYRGVLNKGKDVITVKEELENIKTYIELQLMFYRHRFDAVYRIESSIEEYAALHFLLQPIVENAIEHGIVHKREGRGQLTITGVERDEWLEITVEDNGPGMKSAVLETIMSEAYSGYGLRNVQERIRLFCGERYGLRIRSVEGEGTSVVLLLPKRTLNAGEDFPRMETV